jgi:hypothetical protein
MSDTSGWWAKKLGAQARQRPPTNAEWNQRPLVPQGSPPLYAQPQGAEGAYAEQLARLQQQPERVTTENLFQMAGHWQGGPAHKADPDPCPECGSNQYFSRAAKFSRLPPPAPHCYNCGFNGGLFTQGDASTWGAS